MSLNSFLASYPGRVLVAADTSGPREARLEVLQAADLRPVVLPGFRAFLENRHPRESGDPASLGLAGEPDDSQKSLGPRFRGDDGAGFAIAVATLDDGFALDAEAAGGIPFAILTERPLFPERPSQPSRRRRPGPAPRAITHAPGAPRPG